MKSWINKNYKTLIIGAFLIPIFTVALVSISHVTKWYGISNPLSWAIYLSIGIEIAALSTLAAISADMGKKVYFPFGIVTLIQFIGNVYFAYSFIDIDSKSFRDWIDLVSPMVEFMGVDNTDLIGHKRFLAFFAGGMLPIISLSFLHMLVKFTEEDKKKESQKKDDVNEEKQNVVDSKDIVSEVSRLRLSEDDLKLLEKHLLNPKEPSEKLKQSFREYVDLNGDGSYNESNQEEYIPSEDEEKQNFSTIEPYNVDSEEEFSTIEPKDENIFQKEEEFDGFVPEPFATPEEVIKYGIDDYPSKEHSVPVSSEIKLEEKKN